MPPCLSGAEMSECPVDGIRIGFDKVQVRCPDGSIICALVNQGCYNSRGECVFSLTMTGLEKAPAMRFSCADRKSRSGYEFLGPCS